MSDESATTPSHLVRNPDYEESETEMTHNNSKEDHVSSLQDKKESGNKETLLVKTLDPTSKPHILVIESDKAILSSIDHPDSINLPPPYEDTTPTPPKRQRKITQQHNVPPENQLQLSSQEESPPEDEEEEELSRPQKRYLPMEVYATIIASFSFLCIGLQRAYTSPALEKMKEDHVFFSGDHRLTNTVISWVAATPPLASFFGTILSGLTLQYLGRQKTIVFLSLPYIAGWLTIAFAKTTTALMAGRAMTGLATGFSTAAAPMYVGECVRSKIRGFLGFVPAMMLSLGILLGFALSTINLGWQELALLMAGFPVLLLLCAIGLPESPFWYLYHGKEQEALDSLRKLRDLDAIAPAPPTSMKNMHETPNTVVVRVNPLLELDQRLLNARIEQELEEMKRVLKKRHSLPHTVSLHSPAKRHSHDSVDSEIGRVEEEEEESETFMQFVFTDLLGKREIRYPAFITASLMIFQQFTGANAVIYYLSVILNEADPNLRNRTFYASFRDNNQVAPPREGLDPNVAAVIFGLVQFFSFFLSLGLVDRMGRRVLLMVSALAMIFPHVILGLYFWIKMNPNSYIHVYKYASIIKYTSSWLPLTCLCGFIAGYSIGFGPVPFIIMAEVFPSSARSYMVALASLINHLTLFFIVRVFPIFLDWVGAHITFWFFAVCCFLALIHVAICVPETKGKSLVEIELEFKKELKKEDKVSKKGSKKEKCKCSHKGKK